MSEHGTADKVRWTVQLERQLITVFAWLGTNWDLMHEIYFPHIPAYALKNKYYKLMRTIANFPEVPRFGATHLDLSKYEFTWPLRYLFQERRTLIPDLNPVQPEPWSGSASLEWKADEFSAADDGDEYEDLSWFI